MLVDRKRTDILYITVLSLVTTLVSVFGINRYRFPGMEQGISLSMLKSRLNPDLYPVDFVVQQKELLYSYFWDWFAFSLPFFGGQLELALFIHYFIYTGVTFIAFAYLLYHLSQDRFSVTIGLLLLLFNKSFLGNDYFFDQALDTVGPARALVVVAWLLFSKNKLLSASIVQSVVFLVHPLTGAYSIFMHLCCLLWRFRLKKLTIVCTNVVVIFFCVTPLLLWKLTSTPPGLTAFGVDLGWLELLRVRSPDHIDPFSWSIVDYLYSIFAAFIIVVGTVSANKRNSFLIPSCIGLLILCGFGFVVVHFYPVTTFIQLQLFRSSTFLGPLSVIAFSIWVSESMRERPINIMQLMVLLLGFTLFNVSLNAQVRWYGILAYGLVCFVIVVFLFDWKFFRRPELFVSALVVLLGIGAFIQRGSFTYKHAIDADWEAVQNWANQTSAIDSLFIVPPRSFGFRILSERSSFGNWFDGTVLFFNPTAGREWFNRMQSLGFTERSRLSYFFQNYLQLPEQFEKLTNKLNNIAASEIYLIAKKPYGQLDPALMYENSSYWIYQLR